MSAPSSVDAYLADLDRRLRVPGRYRRRVMAETADHLAEAVEALESSGHTEAGAEAEAVRRFGPADRMAAEIDAGWDSVRARRAPGFAFLAGVGVLAAALAGIPATRGVSPGPAGAAPVALAITVATIAFQLAVVAGGVALLRTLARRSAPVLPAGDRALVIRAARICLAAVAVAAGGFTAVALEQSHRAGLGAGRAIAAAAGMALALALSWTGLACSLPGSSPTTATVPGGPTSPAGSAEPAGNDPSGSGEGGSLIARRGLLEWLACRAESLVALAGSAPGPVTALVAVVAGWGAFSHAETSRAGSVLAGLVEAAAVVVCARLFGPTLGLRRASEAGPERSS